MQHLRKNRTALVLLFVLTAVIAFSVYPPFRSQAQHKQLPPSENEKPGDTTRRKSASSGHTNKTYDEVRIELDRATRELDRELKNLQDQELPRVQEEISRALKELDVAKMQVMIDHTAQDIDFAAIEKETANSIKGIECKELQEKIKTELKMVDLKKMQQQLQELKTTNQLEIQQDLENVRTELGRTQIDIEATMKDARVQLEKARVELKLIQEGIQELEKDGIIKKDDPADIEWDGDVLIVNGKRQSPPVSEKYKAYFKNGKFSFNHTSPKIVL